MKAGKQRNRGTLPLENRLAELEKKVLQKGIHVHYDRLEAAGLKLKGGLCKIKGEYHIFVDKRKSTAEKISILLDCVDQPFPEEPSQND